jgi:hypothetical protein
VIGFKKKLRIDKVLGFDRWIRFWYPDRLARATAETSRTIAKREHLVLCEANANYGNLRALALELKKVLRDDQWTFLAYGPKSQAWALEHEIPARVFRLDPTRENVETWSTLLQAKVAVYEQHDWWRTREQMLKRAQLSGAIKIQLWHGSTGPIGKEIALGRIEAQPAYWHFLAVASTSVGWEALVNEPNGDEARRMQRIQARKSIHDVEFRMTSILNEGRWKPPTQKKVIVAPTFPEDLQGETEVVEWIQQLGNACEELDLPVTVYLHPSSKKALRERIRDIKGIELASGKTPSDVFKEASLLVTDYSSIAHDALLYGTPIMMAVANLETYRVNREILIDEEQWNCAYIVDQNEKFKELIEVAVTSDPLRSSRESYRDSLLSSLSQKPGQNTIDAILQYLHN